MPGGSGTRTGNVLEAAINAALMENGYNYRRQVIVGDKLFGGRYKADFIVDGVIISCKWQQVGGTAEQKILYEIASLIKIVIEHPLEFKRAYLVLGGRGFSKKFKDSLLRQKHREVLKFGELVEVLTLDKMIELLNKGEL